MKTPALNIVVALALLTSVFGLNDHPLAVAWATAAVWLAVQLTIRLNR